MRQPTQPFEERTKLAIPEAMKIIRPEEHPGPMLGGEKMAKHRWQHVERCREVVAGAINAIAAMADTERAQHKKTTPGRRPQKSGPPTIRKNQKEEAIGLAFDLLLDYGGRMPTTTNQREGGEQLEDLATLLYGAATGDAQQVHHENIIKWFEENWLRARRKLTRLPAGDPGKQIDPELLKLIEDDVNALRDDWLNEPPAAEETGKGEVPGKPRLTKQQQRRRDRDQRTRFENTVENIGRSCFISDLFVVPPLSAEEREKTLKTLEESVESIVDVINRIREQRD
jgi:hypothetical protein